MGVIPINFSPEVEVFIKGNRTGTRSAVVDQVMKKYLRSKLSDIESSNIEDLTVGQLVASAINRMYDVAKCNQEWFERALVLRDILLKHLEGEQ